MAVRVKFITLLFLAVQGLVLKLIYPSGKALVKHEPSYLRKDPVIMRRLLNQGDSLWGDAAVNYSCRLQYSFTSAANVTSHCSGYPHWKSFPFGCPVRRIRRLICSFVH